MAKIDYEKLAAEIIGKVGGTENIHTVSHCATRLRFVLKDRSLANEKELRQLQGVLGSVYGSGQFQVILGELMPKSLALQFPKQAALYTYYPMRWTLAFFAWFIDFLNGSGLLLLKLFRLPPGPAGD